MAPWWDSSLEPAVIEYSSIYNIDYTKDADADYVKSRSILTPLTYCQCSVSDNLNGHRYRCHHKYNTEVQGSVNILRGSEVSEDDTAKNNR